MRWVIFSAVEEEIVGGAMEVAGVTVGVID